MKFISTVPITFDEERIDDVVIDQFKILVANPVFNISFAAGEEIISDDHLVALEHQPIDQMRANETNSPERTTTVTLSSPNRSILPSATGHLQASNNGSVQE
jgi:hypothetical protein